MIDNIIEFTMEIFAVIGILILIFILCYALYNIFFIQDEVICLGGHYELRYNNLLKVSLNHFVCDSAKIIYK